MLLQLGLELCWLFAAALLTLHFAASLAIPVAGTQFLALAFALLIVSINGAFGVYWRVERQSVGAYVLRVVLAPAIGIGLAYLVAELVPGGDRFREHVGVVALYALGGLMLVRHAIVLPLVRRVQPRRVLVLGTGPEARLVDASLASASSKRINVIGFYGLDNGEPTLVAPHRVVAADRPLEDLVRQLGVDEVIVAARQQRGGVLPLRSLLECRLNGVQITDLAGFFERVHSRVPIEMLKVSWLIYGDGYRQGWMRALVKRIFDVTIATLLLAITLPVMAVIAVMIMVESGKPVIYRQKRVGRLGKHFTMLKFRSMAADAEIGNRAKWADVNDPRVTRVGRLMRRTRIDELPQLINVMRGEMSLVGPRPERPEFVALLTQEIPFYAARHSINPGITGWAQVRYSYGATVEQSMKKLEYDLFYVKNNSLALDLRILLNTVRVILLGEGAR
jgi:sugar transferase (PEP-CTERM system associated)